LRFGATSGRRELFKSFATYFIEAYAFVVRWPIGTEQPRLQKARKPIGSFQRKQDGSRISIYDGE
jgi:hypothetical protein